MILGWNLLGNGIISARLDGDAVNQTCAPCLRDRESHFRSPGARRLDLNRTLCFDCVRDAFPQYWPFPASSCRPAVNPKAREFEVANIWLRKCWRVRGVSPESAERSPLQPPIRVDATHARAGDRTGSLAFTNSPHSAGPTRLADGSRW